MRPINTKLAPEAIGTYSQAIRSGETVYLSGQIPLDPKTMNMCSGDIKLQITQVIENLSAVCEASGGSLANIVKLSVFLTDLSYFPLINEVMSCYFVEPYPARAVIGVSALPRGAQVEMDCIMVLPAPKS
jgi:reactive intermediate/imine deaminase